MTALDPVTLAVLKGRLEQIADEMDATLYRSAFNPIIAEARDACHGLYHAETGATLVQGTTGLPIFVGAMAFAVKAVIDKVARDTASGRDRLKPGDTFLFNDPYDGGTHLNDFRLVRPVYRDGQLFCWIASVGHWLDIGGNVPGGFNARATECYQEGVRIPPVKFIRQGKIDEDIIDILAANSRSARSNYGDLNGQLNALALGERRLSELLDDYGDETIGEAFAAFSRRAETLMRENLRAIPDGLYTFEDYLDNDGVSDVPLTIALDMTIEGDEMTLDFSRSSPPCAGPLNIAYSTAAACCYVALKHVFPDVPANAGCLAPIRFVIPETTLLGVKAPKPVGGYTETILRVIGVVFGAIAKAAPERAMAAPFGTINALSLAGQRDDGSRCVMFSFFGGGLGGNPWQRRPEPRQQSDLDGDDPASRNPGGLLSGDVHAMGAAPRQRRRRPLARRPRRDLRDRGARRDGRRRVFARRARQVPTVRRRRRRRGRAEPLRIRHAGGPGARRRSRRRSTT